MAFAAIASGECPALAIVAKKKNADVTSKVIYDLAMKGDQPSQKIFEAVGRALGTSLAGMINALNLPMYVIGGGVSSGWDALAPAMMDEILRRAFVFRATSAGRRRT